MSGSIAGMLEPGADAPSFTLADQHGEPATFPLPGRWTVLWWFVRADTPG
jgi:peroxiredoxin Q/BCP